MKLLTPTIFPTLLFLSTTHLSHFTNAKSHFASHSTETHVLHHPKALHPNKKDFLTCEQTYGGGSIECGGSDTTYCYNPTIGESCCIQNDGYCGIGGVCASIEGYCCHKNENLHICTLRLGITQNTRRTPDTDTDADSEDSDSDSDSDFYSTSESSSSSASELESQYEIQTQRITDADSDDQSSDDDDDDDEDEDEDDKEDPDDPDSDIGYQPPLSMLMNAAYSGPSADRDTDVDEDADADSDADAELVSDDAAEILDPDENLGSFPDTNADPESTIMVASLGIGTATATATVVASGSVINAGTQSSVLALKISTLVLASASASSVALERVVETSSSVVEGEAGSPTLAVESTLDSGDLAASTPIGGSDGRFSGGASKVGMGLGLERGLGGGWFVWRVGFVLWWVL